MASGPVEPSADSRVMAKTLHQMFVALTLEGFTEKQALVIMGQLLSAAMPKSDG